MSLGLLAVFDLTLGPPSWPFAVDATMVGGSSLGWRLGFASRAAMQPGLSWSLFGGLASDLVGCTGGCPAVVYEVRFPTQPRYAAFGARTWFRGVGWWVSISPSACLALPGTERIGYNWVDATLGATISGLQPPIAEVGYQINPHLGIALRSSIAPFGLVASF